MTANGWWWIQASLSLPDTIQIAVGITNAAVAVATVYLATKTMMMANQTALAARATANEAEKVARQAAAAEEQIELSRASLDSSIRPWLTRVTPPLSALWGADKTPSVTEIVVRTVSEGSLRIRLHLRNVGSAIALIQSGSTSGSRDQVQTVSQLVDMALRVHPRFRPENQPWFPLSSKGRLGDSSSAWIVIMGSSMSGCLIRT